MYDSIVYGLSGTVSRFVLVFLVPIYTRIFSPEDYGVMSLIATSMALFSVLVVMALDDSAHRWYWDADDVTDQKTTLASWAWCQITLSLAIAGLVFIFSHWLAKTLIKREEAALYFRLASMALPLGVLNVVITNWLRMMRRPWATMLFSFGISLFNILLTILLVVVWDWGLKGVYASQVVTATSGSVIALALLRDWVDPKKFRWSRLKAMIGYSFPLIPASVAYWVVNLSGVYFIQVFSSTSEVGLYQVGSTVASVVTLGIGAFQQAWVPFALSIHREPHAGQVYADVLLAYVWLTCFISTILSLFAPELLRFFTTEAYVSSSPVVGLLAFSYVMVGLRYIAMIGPTIVKKLKSYGVAVTAAAALTISLNILFVPRLGKEGAALATLIGQAAVPLYVFYRSQKLYPIPYRFGAALGVFASAFLLSFLGGRFFVSNLFLAIGIKILLISMFVSTIFILRVMTFEQARNFLLNQHRRMKE